MHKENWDDLRFVLAVAESGSVSAAARLLGVNHATVLRRVAAFEEAQGGPVFEKSLRGYAVRPERLRVIEAAREVQLAVLGVGHLMQGVGAALRGAVRVTSTDTFCLSVLPPIVAHLQQDEPGLRIDLHCTNAHLDMGRMQADVAVRPAEQLSDDLDGRKVGRLGFAIYGTSEAGDRWLGLAGPLGRSVVAGWMAGRIDPVQVVGAADSFIILREMAAAGQGLAMLPCCLGDPDPRLTRHSALRDKVSVPIWVACHADLAGAPRIRAVRDRLALALEAEGPRLAGLA